MLARCTTPAHLAPRLLRAMSTPTATAIPYTVPLTGGIPDTHLPHTERTTTILVPKDESAFLNPVQEYNRDLSVSVIRAWNEERKERLETRWRERMAKGKGRKQKQQETKGDDAATEAAQPEAAADTIDQAGPSTERQYRAPKITILEALSATGLRSIRYAKEIPDVKVVLANDLSASACDAMRRNVALNGVGKPEPKAEATVEGQPTQTAESTEEAAENEPDVGRREGCTGYVHVNEGDACTLMYNHRAPKDRVDVVDLDPYGTAAPFIDAAIGAITDGGLLAVTCTDLAVLAGSNYPEKCFSNYGGVCVNAEYSHEVALRLVLNSLAQAAARYGRVIKPLLSFSIDFYVRLFVRVDTKPVEVKNLLAQTGSVYVCHYCQTPVLQPFGRVVQKTSSKGNVNTLYRTIQGPTAGPHCDECGSPQHIAGPMWLGPIHDPDFAARVLKSIDGDKDKYGTWPRMHGMLTLAHEELPDPFYFSNNTVHGFAHASAGPTKTMVSALLNAGYKVSRSHALRGSVKTNAPRSFVFDIIREEVKKTPVRMDKISETSPARALLLKPMTHTVDLTPNEDAKLHDKAEKTVLYQVNPLPNWGPAARAKDIKTAKRKSEEIADEPVAEAKKPKVVDEEAAMNTQ